MKDVLVGYLVTNTTGFYYRQEHEYKNLDEDDVNNPKLKTIINDLKSNISTFSKGEGELTVNFYLTIDGAAPSDLVVSNVSYKELSKLQRKIANTIEAGTNLGEGKAKDKDTKRGWNKHPG